MHGRVSAGSVRAQSQAAMVGKALARVMQLQRERDALVRRVQVRLGLCPWPCPDAATCRCTAVPPQHRSCPSGVDCTDVCVILRSRRGVARVRDAQTSE